MSFELRVYLSALALSDVYFSFPLGSRIAAPFATLSTSTSSKRLTAAKQQNHNDRKGIGVVQVRVPAGQGIQEDSPCAITS